MDKGDYSTILLIIGLAALVIFAVNKAYGDLEQTCAKYPQIADCHDHLSSHHLNYTTILLPIDRPPSVHECAWTEVYAMIGGPRQTEQMVRYTCIWDYAVDDDVGRSIPTPPRVQSLFYEIWINIFLPNIIQNKVINTVYWLQ